jgi:hypothetical protein
MPLPSQSARFSGARPAMYRRRRSSFGPILVGGVVIVAIAAVVYFLLPSGSREHLTQPGSAAAKPPPAPTQPQASAPAKPPAPVPAPITDLTPKTSLVSEPKSSPPVIEIGQGAAAERNRAKTVSIDPPQSKAPDPIKVPPPVPAPTAASVSSGSGSQPTRLESGPVDQIASVAAARQKEQAGDLVAARLLYSRALAEGKLSLSEQQSVRNELTKINDDLVFSSKVTKEDPYQDTYQVQSGDKIIKINQKLNLAPDWRLLLRINNTDAAHLREGMRLKVIKGPFHVVVHKSQYRLDLYMGPPDKQSDWVYVRSFPVGLGEGNSTPIGSFIVRKGSKLVNPPWTNPRTGEHFDAGPTCPIGKYWIGLEGVGDAASSLGYGLHGTIDPESIGKQKSMGCVRLGTDDIALLYELLGETLSQVKIEP